MQRCKRDGRRDSASATGTLHWFYYTTDREFRSLRHVGSSVANKTPRIALRLGTAHRRNRAWEDAFLNIFVYEFVTGGGWLGRDKAIPASLLREGRAMVTAVTRDLVDLGLRVTLLRDDRLEPIDAPGAKQHTVASAGQGRGLFERFAIEADATLVIAPELWGEFLDCCRRVVNSGGNLLASEPYILSITSDKHATCRHLKECGVPVPPGRILGPRSRLPRSFPLPAVLKPRQGAGSIGVYRIDHFDDFLAHFPQAWPPDEPVRIERFCPGEPLSVSVLCGPESVLVLPPCRQHLSGQAWPRYLGGSFLPAGEVAQRAEALALRVVESFPGMRGYLGIDMILGNDPQAEEDFVIEVNPRLTTSYLGLRAACEKNLAGAMLAIYDGQRFSLGFDLGPLEFDSSGNVTRHTR